MTFSLCGCQNRSGSCAGRENRGFYLWIEINVVLSMGIEVVLVFVSGLNDLFLLCVLIDIPVVFVRVVEVDWVLVCWPKITWL